MHCARTIFNSHSGAVTLILRTAKAKKTTLGEKKFTRKSTGGGGSELLNKFWPNFLQFIPSALQLGCETSPFLSLVGALLRTHAHTRVYISPWRENALSFYIYMCASGVAHIARKYIRAAPHKRFNKKHVDNAGRNKKWYTSADAGERRCCWWMLMVSPSLSYAPSLAVEARWWCDASRVLNPRRSVRTFPPGCGSASNV